MAVTRSDLISTLKSRGVKGKLSKMWKHELQELVHQSALADKWEPTGIMLEPNEQAGGHCAGKLAKVCHDAYGDSDGDGTDADFATRRAQVNERKEAIEKKKRKALTAHRTRLTERRTLAKLLVRIRSRARKRSLL